MIDNYDSFTYNLCSTSASPARSARLHRNDEITLEQIGAPRARAPRQSRPAASRPRPASSGGGRSWPSPAARPGARFVCPATSVSRLSGGRISAREAPVCSAQQDLAGAPATLRCGRVPAFAQLVACSAASLSFAPAIERSEPALTVWSGDGPDRGDGEICGAQPPRRLDVRGQRTPPSPSCEPSAGTAPPKNSIATSGVLAGGRLKRTPREPGDHDQPPASPPCNARSSTARSLLSRCSLMRQIMAARVSPVMTAAIPARLRAKKETIGGSPLPHRDAWATRSMVVIQPTDTSRRRRHRRRRLPTPSTSRPATIFVAAAARGSASTAGRVEQVRAAPTCFRGAERASDLHRQIRRCIADTGIGLHVRAQPPPGDEERRPVRRETGRAHDLQHPRAADQPGRRAQHPDGRVPPRDLVGIQCARAAAPGAPSTRWWSTAATAWTRCRSARRRWSAS